MAIKFLDALGGVADVLGIGGFFGDIFRDVNDANGEEQILAELADIRAGLGELQQATDTLIELSLAEPLSGAASALEYVNDFRNSGDDDTERQTAQTFAIRDSRDALNDAITNANSVMENGTYDQLAYTFGVLHHAMIVRQLVATTVGDGPLGDAGLHRKLSEAASILYNEDAPEQSLIGQMEERITAPIQDGSSDLRAPYISPGPISNIPELFLDRPSEEFFDKPLVFRSNINGDIVANYGTNVLMRSSFTDSFSSRLVIRSDFDDYPSYLAAVTAQETARTQAVITADKADLSFNKLFDLAVVANDYLADIEANGSFTGEQILSALDDIAEGTSLADYIKGQGGDDVLSGDPAGAGGPDALAGDGGNDILRGNGFADFLTGGAGNDFIIGGTNIGDALAGDVARFEGLSSDYQIIGGTTYAIVIGPDGSRDKIFDVEYLRFDNEVIELGAGSALDGKGELEDFITAETIALLYEAALDRDSDPRGIDAPGLNFWTGYAEELLTDEGLGLREMSETIAGFLMDSPEFTTKFGNVNNMNNTEFLEQVYQNILGRAPDTGSDGEIGGLEFYLGLLDASQITREGALADIAISPENAEQSADVLMTLFQDSTPEQYQNTDILLEWSFVS